VIHIFHDEDAARKGINNSFVSQIILTNVRVLAIGPEFQEKKWGARHHRSQMQPWNSRRAQAETIVWRRNRPAVADLAQHDRCERGQRQHPLHNGSRVVRNGVEFKTGHIERVVSREQISIARNGERTL